LLAGLPTLLPRAFAFAIRYKSIWHEIICNSWLKPGIEGLSPFQGKNKLRTYKGRRYEAETASKSTVRWHKMGHRLSERERTEEGGGHSRLKDAQKEDRSKKSCELLDRNSNQEEAVAGGEITSAAENRTKTKV
jgi:hypothetical protein